MVEIQNLVLTEEDIEAIIRVAATEVGDERYIRSHPEIIAQMAEGVADTMINRVFHPGHPDTISEVANFPWAFSAIRAERTRYNPKVFGSWQEVPDSAVSPFLREHLINYLQGRARGEESRLSKLGIPGAVNFANPHTSSPSNLESWINPMIQAGGVKIGVPGTTFLHWHGTDPDIAQLGYSPTVSIDGITRHEPGPDPEHDLNTQERAYSEIQTEASRQAAFDAMPTGSELNRARYGGPVPPNPTPRSDDLDADQLDSGSLVVDPRLEPLFRKMDTKQLEGIRSELDEVRAERRRQSDYEATTLQERMARSLQRLRESGRTDDDLDDAGILNTLGEQQLEDYARQRDGARRYHHAVAGMESLPDHEIEERMVALRSTKAEPGDEGAALQSDVARHVQALRAERQTDPAMAVRRIPEMKQAESELNPDDRESVSAFVGEGLRWQAVQGISPSAQRAVPRELAQTLADGILAQQADARRDGVRPAVAMRASIDGIRNVFGDVHARSVMNSAFAAMRGADHLASMARQMFDRDEMGGMMSPAVPQMMSPVAHGQGAGGPALKPMGRVV